MQPHTHSFGRSGKSGALREVTASANEHPSTPYSACRTVPGPSNTELLASWAQATGQNHSHIDSIIILKHSCHEGGIGTLECVGGATFVHGGRLGSGHIHRFEDVPHHFVRDQLMKLIHECIPRDQRRAVEKNVFTDLSDKDLDAYRKCLRETHKKKVADKARVQAELRVWDAELKRLANETKQPTLKRKRAQRLTELEKELRGQQQRLMTENQRLQNELSEIRRHNDDGSRGGARSNRLPPNAGQNMTVSELEAAISAIDCDVPILLYPCPTATRDYERVESISKSCINPNGPLVEEEQDVDTGTEIRYNCDQIRTLIARFIQLSDWTIDEFRKALGVPRKNLLKFLQQDGPFKGLKSNVFQLAWEFFEIRHLAGVPMPDDRSESEQSDIASEASAESGQDSSLGSKKRKRNEANRPIVLSDMPANIARATPTTRTTNSKTAKCMPSKGSLPAKRAK